MLIILFLVGVLAGLFINTIINTISINIKLNSTDANNDESTEKTKYIKYYLSKNKVAVIFSNIFPVDTRVVLVTIIALGISFYEIGFNISFLKVAFYDTILIIVSFIDVRFKIIPNTIVLFTLIVGIFFIILGDISFLNAIMGMLIGGGMLFLLALIPNVLGGGDIKFMFASGAFLGASNSIKAILIAFITSSIISIILIVLRIKGRKDYIPFGPFLALGSFLAFHFNIIPFQ